MNRRSFFRLAVGAAVTPLVAKPLMALAGNAEAMTFRGSSLCGGVYNPSTADMLGIGRLSTPFPSGVGVLTPEIVRRCMKRWEKQYS